MKKILSVAIIFLIVLSTFSILTSETRAEPDETPLEVAEKAAVWIIDEAEEPEVGKYRWKWYTPKGELFYQPSLSRGAAGYGIFFLSLYEETGNALYLDYAEGAAKWLITQAVSSYGGYKWPYGDDERSDWWLSTMMSPIGEFFLRIYKMTGESIYLDYANGAAQWLTAMAYWGEPGCFVPYNPPERYGWQSAFGVWPGREVLAATFLLHMYQETGDTDYLTIVEGTAEWLMLVPDKKAESGGYTWEHGRPFVISHPIYGMSQIALFFYEIYQAFGDVEYLEHANGAMTWLLTQAVVNGDKVKWPEKPGASEYITLPLAGSHALEWNTLYEGTEPRQCDLLLVAHSVTGNSTYLEYARKLANWVTSPDIAVPEGRGYKFRHREGYSIYDAYQNARVFNFLRWIHNATGEPSYLEYANGALAWIVHNAEETDGGYKWRTRVHPYYATWFRPGAAGIGYYLISALAHDVAVTHAAVSPSEVVTGDPVSINVTVENQGDFTETFEVSTWYDDTIIETKTDITLVAGATATLTFTWDTTGVAKGIYTIKAEASTVPDEHGTSDNVLVDDKVTVKKIASTISISADPARVTMGKPTTIRGYITPVRAGATVTIWQRLSWEPTWNILTTAATDQDSRYSHVWSPTPEGIHELKAAWLGDEKTLPVESLVVTLEVRTPMLSIKLAGEHDYLLMENVKVRLAALVKEATTKEPVSNADVTINIYDADGGLWVSDTMVERLAGTGIYEWESEKTIRLLRLKKGVYLAHVTASLHAGQTVSDILEFHVDPPQEQPPTLQTILLVAMVGVALIASVWYVDHRRLTRKLARA